jgi:glycine/D-amino acid oxidase-like deaminating enzyme
MHSKYACEFGEVILAQPERSSIDVGHRSWWLDEALRNEGEIAAAPPLTEDIDVDVAVVGGGFTGLWTAIALHERNPSLKIALLEAESCGSGASGKNGGKVHGYWSRLPGLAATLGDDAALAVARAGTRAQDGIRAFISASHEDVWWREAGNIRISASAAQDARLKLDISEAARLGVSDTVQYLSVEELGAYCRAPLFRGGVLFQEGATVQPARLARLLRKQVLARGISIYENTRMLGLDAGQPTRIRTPKGNVVAREVILATNTDLGSHPAVRNHVTVFSSYAVMTEALPERLEEINWRSDVGLSDARMFVHYFRRTPDGHVLMGSGSGPISYGGRATDLKLFVDRAAAGRARHGLYHLLPGLGPHHLEGAWGGPIDMSSDRLPFFKTISGTRIHYGAGFSGHGVNATYIAGQCLASLALQTRDEWSSLPFCTREIPRFPPEPFRYAGGQLIRWGVMACEEAEDIGEQPPAVARVIAALPRALGLRIGTR